MRNTIKIVAQHITWKFNIGFITVIFMTQPHHTQTHTAHNLLIAKPHTEVIQVIHIHTDHKRTYLRLHLPCVANIIYES